MGKIWENDRVMQKMLKRYLDGKCVSCGHKPCSCKSKGKFRNRKAIGKNESHEPMVGMIPVYAEQLEIGEKHNENFTKIVEAPAMSPKDSVRYINVNKIAEGIEKANAVLVKLRLGGTLGVNHDAIATWERIIAALQMHWRDAMIEVQTAGHYSFE